MGCDGWGKKIELYLDGELPESEMRELDSHVRQCPSCASALLGGVRMKRAVHAAAIRFSPDPAFRTRVQQLVVGRSRKVRSWAPQFATAALAVILVAAIPAAYFFHQRSRTAQVYGEVADLHVSTLASASPVDVVSTDRHTVKPWFAGKIPFTFNLPELQGTPFTLVGGRVTYLDQVPGAELIYQIRQHRISIFIFPERFTPGALPSDSSSKPFRSFNAETWTQAGLRYFVIGDAGSADIRNLAELFKKA